MKIFRRCIFVIQIIFISYSLFGQDNLNPQWVWNEATMAGIKPQLIGVQPINSCYTCFYAFDSEGNSYICQGFESENPNFLIAYEVNNFPITSDDSILVNVLNPNFPKISMDSLYLNRVEKDLKYHLDDKYKSLQKSPIRYYPEAEAKSKFNADHALNYPLSFTKGERKHKPIRKYCETLILHKSGRGYVVMYCYYDKKKQKDECLRIAEGIFRYREPEEFIEYSDKDIEIPLKLNKKQ